MGVWWVLGSPWTGLGGPWGSLGDPWGVLGGSFGVPGRCLGAPWGVLWGSLGVLGDPSLVLADPRRVPGGVLVVLGGARADLMGPLGANESVENHLRFCSVLGSPWADRRRPGCRCFCHRLLGHVCWGNYICFYSISTGDETLRGTSSWPSRGPGWCKIGRIPPLRL